MAKKMLVILGLVMFCMAQAYAYTLIDSETFETYTNWAQGSNPSSFLSESTDVWLCTSTYTTNGCAKCAVGGCTGTGNFSIQNTGINNWMSIYSLGIDYITPKYYEVSLDWNSENSTNFSYQNTSTDFIFKYDVRLVSADTTVGGGGNTYRSHFAMDYARSIGGINDKLTIGLGGTNLAINDSNFQRIHSYGVNPYAANWATPATPASACDISDGDWHTIVARYRTNATYALLNWTLFVDGNSCYTLSGVPLRQYLATESFFTNNLRVYVRGGFWTNIDNISTWASEASEDFLGAELSTFQCDDDSDNDGDGFTDYGSDPRCDSVVDDSEAPYDYVSTLCDEISPPIYLKESFNGYIAGCNWFTTHNILPTSGQLVVTSSSSPYVQSKPLSADVTATMSRYFTLKFDLNVNNIATDNFLDIRLYDVDYTNFWIFYMGGTTLTIYTTNDGVNTNVTSILYNTSYTYKIIVDLQSKTYDAYLNSTFVADNFKFIDNFAAIDDVYFFKFAALQSDFTLDNIIIYTSDVTGAMLSPSTTTTQVSNVTMMCGLFYKVTPNCTQDSDCATSDCLPNGRCNSFNMGYCDEKGYVRGNKCITGAIAGCAAKNITDIILDNLLYVLAFVIVLIIIAYLIIITRRRG
jgi:hypothetical protein